MKKALYKEAHRIIRVELKQGNSSFGRDEMGRLTCRKLVAAIHKKLRSEYFFADVRAAVARAVVGQTIETDPLFWWRIKNMYTECGKPRFKVK